MPAGVLNVVNGDAEAVDAILGAPEIGAISFVGSTKVAEHVYATGTNAGKRVQALGGAHGNLEYGAGRDAGEDRFFLHQFFRHVK